MTRAELIAAYASGRRNFIGANLSDADLSGANLAGANLSGANLTGANLSGVHFNVTRGIEYAICNWAGHGEKGRQISAVKINDEIIFFCGCFEGDARALIDYIINGPERYRSSRYKALDFLLSCF